MFRFKYIYVPFYTIAYLYLSCWNMDDLLFTGAVSDGNVMSTVWRSSMAFVELSSEVVRITRNAPCRVCGSIGTAWTTQEQRKNTDSPLTSRLSYEMKYARWNMASNKKDPWVGTRKLTFGIDGQVLWFETTWRSSSIKFRHHTACRYKFPGYPVGEGCVGKGFPEQADDMKHLRKTRTQTRSL